YQELARLLRELQQQRIELLQDLPWDFLAAAAGAASSQAEGTVSASAGRPKPSAAALSGDSPGAAEATDLGARIREIGTKTKEIKSIRADAVYESTIGPAPKPIDDVIHDALSSDDLVRAFLAMSNSNAFQRLFDQSQQAHKALETSINDAQSQL